MSLKNLISGVFPLFGNEPWDLGALSLGSKHVAVEPLMAHWLYTWERSSARTAETTEFEKTIGHTQFTDAVGHPWCNKGYGDALTLTISQLMKSEVAVMLSNAASSIDNSSEGLIWDEAQSRFVPSRGEVGERGSAVDAASVDAGVIAPLMASVIAKFFDDTSIGNKMRSVTDMACQLNDAEAEAHMFEDSVYFCYVEDIVAATLICGESEQVVDCPASLDEYAHTSEDFPAERCVVSNHTLHREYLPTAISWNDTQLVVPLLMVDLLRSTRQRALPRFVSTDVSLQESLTYLALYRSNIIAASYSRQPYLCGADRVRAPVLIPGWTLPKVLTVMPEGDPIFSAPTENNTVFSSPASKLRNDAVPLVFISQSSVAPCSFVVTVRGTATMWEWIQDFTYGQTPFFADSRIKTHVGFTRILSAVLPPLETFLTEQSARHRCRCQDTHIFLTGHSLGAGVAQLLALHLALRYKRPLRIQPPRSGSRAPRGAAAARPFYGISFDGKASPGGGRESALDSALDGWQNWPAVYARARGLGEDPQLQAAQGSFCPIDISAVVFSPPRVLNAYGSEQYRQLVNGRIVLDSGDGLAYIPCYDGNSRSGWPRCGADHMLRASGKGRDHYADNYGIVEISVEYTEKRGGKTIDAIMQSIFPPGQAQSGPSVLSTLVGKLFEAGIPGLSRVPSLGAMGASHVCSAACKFSQAACGAHFRWWCDKCPMLI